MALQATLITACIGWSDGVKIDVAHHEVSYIGSVITHLHASCAGTARVKCPNDVKEMLLRVINPFFDKTFAFQLPYITLFRLQKTFSLIEMWNADSLLL